MIHRKIFVRATGFCLAVLLLASAGWGLNHWLTFRRPNVARESTFLLRPEYSFPEFLDSLASSGILRHPERFRRAAAERDLARYLKPGRYIFKSGMSNQTVIRMIANGWQTPMRLVFRGYQQSPEELAAWFGRNFASDSAEFAAVLLDSAVVRECGFKPETFLAMFLADTYEFYWTDSPEQVVRRFRNEYDRYWNQERKKLAAEAGLTPTEVIILASIVARESNLPEDQARIAGVYLNRIRRGIRLQACPTVIFALKDTEPGIRRVLKRHLRTDSPYNTYRYAGLPPGPIGIPGRSAIEAVLHYDKNNYLYFCASPELDGTHRFAATYSEHQRNAREYQRAFSAWDKARTASRNTASS